MFGAEYSDYLTLLRKSNQIIGCLSSIRDKLGLTGNFGLEPHDSFIFFAKNGPLF